MGGKDRFSDRIQERHVCAATASKVVQLSEGTHCFLRWRTWEGLRVKDVGTKGCDCINLRMST